MNATFTAAEVLAEFDKFTEHRTERYTDQEVDDVLWQIAADYVSVYEGDFDYLVEMKRTIDGDGKQLSGRMLSKPQARGILNCMVAELRRRNQSRQAVRGLDISTLNGRYAAENEIGVLIFVQVSPWKEHDGWYFVDQVIGGHENKPVGKQRPGGLYEGQCIRVLKNVLADPMGCMLRFGIELGYCGACGKHLTDETSRRIGMGPVCRGDV